MGVKRRYHIDLFAIGGVGGGSIRGDFRGSAHKARRGQVDKPARPSKPGQPGGNSPGQIFKPGQSIKPLRP